VGERGNAYSCHGAREGKRPFRSRSRRQEYNIKVDLQEIGIMWTGLTFWHPSFTFKF